MYPFVDNLNDTTSIITEKSILSDRSIIMFILKNKSSMLNVPKNEPVNNLTGCIGVFVMYPAKNSRNKFIK